MVAPAHQLQFPVTRQPDLPTASRRGTSGTKGERAIMRRIAVISLVMFVALPFLACAEADAGSASADAAAMAGAPDGPPLYYLLSGPAKRYCSGIWVSERDRTEALYGSVLNSEDQVLDYEGGEPGVRCRRGQAHRHRLAGRGLGPCATLRRPGLRDPPARHRRRVLHATRRRERPAGCRDHSLAHGRHASGRAPPGLRGRGAARPGR